MSNSTLTGTLDQAHTLQEGAYSDEDDFDDDER